MARQTINIGTRANDASGDTIRDAFDKVNDNTTELYNRMVSKTPTATGASGDVAGQLAFDATNLYVCVADYDGSTVIWKKLVLQSI